MELAKVLSWHKQRLKDTEPGCGLPLATTRTSNPCPLSHPMPAEVQTGLDQIS